MARGEVEPHVLVMVGKPEYRCRRRVLTVLTGRRARRVVVLDEACAGCDWEAVHGYDADGRVTGARRKGRA